MTEDEKREALAYLTRDRIELVRRHFIPPTRELRVEDLDAYDAFCKIERAVHAFANTQ